MERVFTTFPNEPSMRLSLPKVPQAAAPIPMNIFLINPACLDVRVTDEDALLVPMGLFYIGALLKENGFNVRVVNLAVEQNPMDHLRAMIVAERPAIVGFSVLNATRFSAIEGAMVVKEVDPEIKVAFGGPCATFLCDHLFSTCSALDYVVKGEGEFTFLELAERVRDWGKDQNSTLHGGCEIKGLAHRYGHPIGHHDGHSIGQAIASGNDSGIVHTPERKPIEDLDSLPIPGRYFDLAHVSLSRGCPGRCTFCGSPRFWPGSRVRFHSPAWFVEQLCLLNQRGITHFFVSDDTFTMDKKRVIEVCQLIIEKKLAITWVAISRADFIDPGILGWMRKAGCTQISFGVESGSAAIRQRLGKPMNRDRIVRAFALTASFGMLPRAYFIYGSPGETAATIEESLDLIMDIRPLGSIFYMLVLFPGTGLYENLVNQGKLVDSVWSQKIEDIAWFELDPDLDLGKVKGFGHELRQRFYSNLSNFATGVELVDDSSFYPLHADFLSRLAMTFSHGEYSQNPLVKDPMATARTLYERALAYHPDHRAFLGLAMMFQKERQFDRAVDMAAQGLSYFKSSKNLTICMAVSLMNLGRFKKALGTLEPLKEDPEVKVYVKACKERI